MLEPGFCFVENHAGTNAAALSLITGEPAWTVPRQNYCSLLTGYALYSVPASTGGMSVILTLITTQKQMSGWPVALLQQLGCSIDLALRQMPPPARRTAPSSISPSVSARFSDPSPGA